MNESQPSQPPAEDPTPDEEIRRELHQIADSVAPVEGMGAPNSADHPDPSSDRASQETVLKIHEAAAVLRIGRTCAYELARKYRATGGAEGLPVVRLGKALRVPRVRLEELIGAPITWPITEASEDDGSERQDGADPDLLDE